MTGLAQGGEPSQRRGRPECFSTGCRRWPSRTRAPCVREVCHHAKADDGAPRHQCDDARKGGGRVAGRGAELEADLRWDGLHTTQLAVWRKEVTGAVQQALGRQTQVVALLAPRQPSALFTGLKYLPSLFSQWMSRLRTANVQTTMIDPRQRARRNASRRAALWAFWSASARLPSR